MHVHHWPAPEPRYVVLLAHGYGEHAGRYEHVAARLTADGGEVYAPDHRGHGATEAGERALVDDVEAIVSDLREVAQRAAAEHPDLPTVLIGHSMGGLIATRYAQRYGDGLTALVLSAPVAGVNPDLLALAEMDPIPEIPIDPAALSRDPAVGEAYAADPLVFHGPFAKETLLGLAAAIEAVAAGGALTMPTLWLHGDDDAIVPLHQTRPAIEAVAGEHFEQKVYPGARHEIFNETNRDEVLDDVLEFLGRVRSSR